MLERRERLTASSRIRVMQLSFSIVRSFQFLLTAPSAHTQKAAVLLQCCVDVDMNSVCTAMLPCPLFEALLLPSTGVSLSVLREGFRPVTRPGVPVVAMQNVHDLRQRFPQQPEFESKAEACDGSQNHRGSGHTRPRVRPVPLIRLANLLRPDSRHHRTNFSSVAAEYRPDHQRARHEKGKHAFYCVPAAGCRAAGAGARLHVPGPLGSRPRGARRPRDGPRAFSCAGCNTGGWLAAYSGERRAARRPDARRVVRKVWLL